ncbi:MAG: hypothetical protein ACYC3S_07175 [Chloroflexota bacterium]
MPKKSGKRGAPPAQSIPDKGYPRRTYVWQNTKRYAKMLDGLGEFAAQQVAADVLAFAQKEWAGGISEPELHQGSRNYKEPTGDDSRRVKLAKARQIHVLRNYRVVFTFLDEKECICLVHVFRKSSKSNEELLRAINWAIEIQERGSCE